MINTSLERASASFTLIVLFEISKKNETALNCCRNCEIFTRRHFDTTQRNCWAPPVVLSVAASSSWRNSTPRLRFPVIFGSSLPWNNRSRFTFFIISKRVHVYKFCHSFQHKKRKTDPHSTRKLKFTEN